MYSLLLMKIEKNDVKMRTKNQEVFSRLNAKYILADRVDLEIRNNFNQVESMEDGVLLWLPVDDAVDLLWLEQACGADT